MKTTGIYIINSIVHPDRYYIGSANNIGLRWNNHVSTLKRGTHRSPQLQNHVDKYGIDDIIFSILEECNEFDLLKIEQYYLDTFNPFFNTLKIAGSPKGQKRKPEFGKIISEKQTGRKLSEETKKRISDSSKGKKASNETKLKMSIARKLYHEKRKNKIAS